MVHIPGLSRPFKTSLSKQTPPDLSAQVPSKQEDGSAEGRNAVDAKSDAGRAVSLEPEVDLKTVQSDLNVEMRKSTEEEKTRPSSRLSQQTSILSPRKSSETARSSSASPGPINIGKDRHAVGKRDRKRSTDTASSSSTAGEVGGRTLGLMPEAVDDNKVSRNSF